MTPRLTPAAIAWAVPLLASAADAIPVTPDTFVRAARRDPRRKRELRGGGAGMGPPMEITQEAED